MSGRAGSEAQALRRLTRELRVEPAPELDWDRLEQTLLTRAAGQSQAPITATRIGFVYALVAVAAAAALVVGSAGSQPSVEAPQTSSAERKPSSPLPGPLNGDALVVGTRISAGAEQQQIEHPGRVSYILAPHSTAVLSMRGELIGVRLESGTLFAQVVPAARPESFAVDVGQARVLVHGTVFSVERRVEHAVVEVSEGTVGVQPLNGHGPGWVLHAPARGRFSLDGTHGTIERLGPTESGRRLARPSTGHAASEPARSSSGVPKVSVAAQPGELPQSPSIGDVESGVSRVIDVVSGCFARHTHAPKDMQVTATPVLTLSVAPDGRISMQQFVPPLAPEVEQCNGQELDRVRFAPSRDGIRLVRHLELTAR